MELPENVRNIPLTCYVNGRLKILTIEQAYTMFWRTAFAWLITLDWFKSKAKRGYMRDFVTKSTKLFAFSLFTRGYLALTINDSCVLDGDGFPPSRNTFQAKAYKLSKIFNNKPPFIFDECLLGKKELVPCYRMIPGQEWLIIVGVDPKSEFKDTEIDWNLFLTSP